MIFVTIETAAHLWRPIKPLPLHIHYAPAPDAQSRGHFRGHKHYTPAHPTTPLPNHSANCLVKSETTVKAVLVSPHTLTSAIDTDLVEEAGKLSVLVAKLVNLSQKTIKLEFMRNSYQKNAIYLRLRNEFLRLWRICLCLCSPQRCS